jgi:hypothetical protein
MQMTWERKEDFTTYYRNNYLLTFDYGLTLTWQLFPGP